MWKPGTAAPTASTATVSLQPKATESLNKFGNGSTSPHTPSKRKAALSGATMGMRFMQRKGLAASATKARKEDEEKLAKEREQNEWGTSSAAMNQEADEEQSLLPVVASQSDMHGIGANIIGRRSFNGFHKAVNTTWVSAVETLSPENSNGKTRKENISDEELLRRYQQHVKGTSPMNSEPKKKRNTKRKHGKT
jgi:hypothetical protein